MDGETYGSVNASCNLGDILDGDGGADLLLQLESGMDG